MKYNKKYYEDLIAGIEGFLDISWYRKKLIPHYLKHKKRYQLIADKLGLPLCVVPLIAQKEYGDKIVDGKPFDWYLGNGQSLKKKTTIVPKGRGPFLTWEQGVEDAIKYDGLHKVKKWDLPRLLFELEKYNGPGYFNRGKPSPYLWAFCKPYHGKTGLYVGDRKYDPNAVPKNIGAYALYTLLVEADTDFSISDKDIALPIGEEQKSIWSILFGLLIEFFKYVEKESEAKDDPNEIEKLILEKNPELPEKGIKRALDFLKNPMIINQRKICFVDFDKSSRAKRMYLIDLKTGESKRYKVAHGKKSDPGHDGIADSYSNAPGSHKSSLGAMVALQAYGKKDGGWSKFDRAVKLKGLERGLNDKVEERAIVFHGASYINQFNDQISGRSLGCFAVDDDIAKEVQDQIVGGTLLYAWDSDYL